MKLSPLQSSGYLNDLNLYHKTVYNKFINNGLENYTKNPTSIGTTIQPPLRSNIENPALDLLNIIVKSNTSEFTPALFSQLAFGMIDAIPRVDSSNNSVIPAIAFLKTINQIVCTLEPQHQIVCAYLVKEIIRQDIHKEWILLPEFADVFFDFITHLDSTCEIKKAFTSKMINAQLWDTKKSYKGAKKIIDACTQAAVRNKNEYLEKKLSQESLIFIPEKNREKIDINTLSKDQFQKLLNLYHPFYRFSAIEALFQLYFLHKHYTYQTKFETIKTKEYKLYGKEHLNYLYLDLNKLFGEAFLNLSANDFSDKHLFKDIGNKNTFTHIAKISDNMTFYVTSQIYHQPSIKKSVAVLQFFITLMEKCIDEKDKGTCNNLAAALSIYTGIQHNIVVEIVRNLSKPYADILKSYDALFNLDNSLENLRKFIEKHPHSIPSHAILLNNKEKSPQQTLFIQFLLDNGNLNQLLHTYLIQVFSISFNQNYITQTIEEIQKVTSVIEQWEKLQTEVNQRYPVQQPNTEKELSEKEIKKERRKSLSRSGSRKTKVEPKTTIPQIKITECSTSLAGSSSNTKSTPTTGSISPHSKTTTSGNSSPKSFTNSDELRTTTANCAKVSILEMLEVEEVEVQLSHLTINNTPITPLYEQHKNTNTEKRKSAGSRPIASCSDPTDNVIDKNHI